MRPMWRPWQAASPRGHADPRPDASPRPRALAAWRVLTAKELEVLCGAEAQAARRRRVAYDWGDALAWFSLRKPRYGVTPGSRSARK